jgi:hypothetical protein
MHLLTKFINNLPLHFITVVNAGCNKRGFKFGIEVQTTVERASQINKETSTDLWDNAIEKEMMHVFPAFKILDKNEPPPIASKFIGCHMHFELKIDQM